MTQFDEPAAAAGLSSNGVASSGSSTTGCDEEECLANAWGEENVLEPAVPAAGEEEEEEDLIELVVQGE